MNPTVAQRLRSHGIQPSAQRLAVAGYVLTTEDHPSADQVFARVASQVPMLSRATVYNTLNLFVAKGLLRPLVLSEGKVVFDPHTERHHHFIDEDSGAIHDIPWDAVPVGDVSRLKGLQINDYMVVMRGKKLGAPRPSSKSKSHANKRRATT